MNSNESPILMLAMIQTSCLQQLRRSDRAAPNVEFGGLVRHSGVHHHEMFGGTVVWPMQFATGAPSGGVGRCRLGLFPLLIAARDPG